jgi:hypothetical protein
MVLGIPKVWSVVLYHTLRLAVACMVADIYVRYGTYPSSRELRYLQQQSK